MAALNHNKRMNAGLLHEILIRELAAAVISENTGRAAAVVSLIDSYFSKGPLAEELAIHDVALEARGIPMSVAQKIVDEIKIAGAKLDRVGSGKMKRQLAGKMSRILGEDPFTRIIPTYKAHASVDLLIQRPGGRKISEAADLARVEEYLVRHMSSNEPEPKRVEEGASRLAYSIALDSYQAEYGKALDSQQRELLAEHVKVSLGASPKGTAKKLEKHRKAILAAIKSAPLVEGVGSDRVMVDRLAEARRELEAMDMTDTGASTIERLMLFHDLRREIEG